MNFSHLTIFLNLCQTGSIHKAAKLSYTSPQNISKILSKMEEELNAQLFDRSSTGVNLTSAGKLFFKYAKDTLANYQLTKNQIAALVEKDKQIDYNLFLCSACEPYVGHIMSSCINIVNANLYVYESNPLAIVEKVFSSSNSLGIIPYYNMTDLNKYYEPLISNLLIIPLLEDEEVCIYSPQTPQDNLHRNPTISLKEFFSHANIVLPREHPITCLAKEHIKSDSTSKIYLDSHLYGRSEKNSNDPLISLSSRNIVNSFAPLTETQYLISFEEDLKYTVSLICTPNNLNSDLTQTIINLFHPDNSI